MTPRIGLQGYAVKGDLELLHGRVLANFLSADHLGADHLGVCIGR